MKAVFLCAGYGTRLYPLTRDKPKALLSIGGEPLLNHLLRKLEPIQEIDHAILVSNDRFYEGFSQWAKTIKSRIELRVVNDHTTSNENRLGAIRDLKLGLDQIDGTDDILVLASDNLFDSDLASFVSFAKEKNAPAAVGVFDIKDKSLASKYGLIKTDEAQRVTSFLEKPKDPPVTLASMGIYYLSEGSLPLLDKYLSKGQNPDAPGYYIGWLSQETDLYAHQFEGKWFDIGDLDSYKKADEHYYQIGKK
jgi:glucose-1-phosphate thymidylyltransferase